MPNKPTISVVIVNYQSRKELRRCLESLDRFLSTAQLKFEVVVVNNDPDNLNLTENEKLTLPLTVINNPSNSGFGAGSNLGARKARGKFLFFLNPDTELVDDSLTKMLSFLRNNRKRGIVGAKIIEASRKAPQPWTSGKKTSVLNILFRNTFNKPWNKKQPVSVDWVSGTALLIRKKLFHQLDGFDENFWMYFEDQDLCLRAKQKNKEVFFFPHCQVLHRNGKSWKNNKNKKNSYYQSQKYFFQKHHGAINNWLLNLLHKFKA